MVSKSMTEQLKKPIERFSIYGNYISGDKLGDVKYQGSSKYKYFVVLHGDDHFARHPFRAVALINSEERSYSTTESEYGLKNIEEILTRDQDLRLHGFIDFTYLIMLHVQFIRQSDYILTLELAPNELKKLNSRLAIGVGIIPKLQPQFK